LSTGVYNHLEQDSETTIKTNKQTNKTPRINHFKKKLYRLKQDDSLSLKVQDQPEKHSENISKKKNRTFKKIRNKHF
jgi:hypothetical protein